jgi:hypothetical protein
MPIEMLKSIEALLNAICNEEVDDACMIAEDIVKKYTVKQDYAAIININDLRSGFNLDSPRLHRALSTIIARTASNIDFDTLTELFEDVLKQSARSKALVPLCPALIVELVTNGCSAGELVQSSIFPYLLMHLLEPGSVNTQDMETALAFLINQDPDLVLLIDRHLAILVNKKDSVVYARIMFMRLSLAIQSGNCVLVKIISDSLFSDNAQDVLLLAGAIETCTAAVKSAENVKTLVDSKVIDRIINLVREEDVLCDVAISLFIMCVEWDIEMISILLGLFTGPRVIFDSKRHPAALKLEIMIYAFNGDPIFAHSVVSSAVHETGVRQLNAVSAVNRLLTFGGGALSTERQKQFFTEHFKDFFDFISSQIPLKGDLVLREAMYVLLEAAVSKRWLLDMAVASKRLFRFLLDRSSDVSNLGLESKYRIVKVLAKSGLLEGDLKSRCDAYLAEGLHGQGHQPIPNVASQYI